MSRKLSLLALAALLVGCTASPAPTGPEPSSVGLPGGPGPQYYKKWSNGPNPTGDPNVFPITVWMQDPSGMDAGRLTGAAYKDVGVPATLGLWDDEWWYRRKDALYETDWKAYVSPSKVEKVLAEPDKAKHFLGYLVADEPDMQKALGDRFHPEMQPSAILQQADEVRKQDPSRPTFINFGVWMGTPDGGVGYGYIEKDYETDMRTYCQAADIASADYYGWTHPEADKSGAYTYGQVIDTMRKWCGPDKPIYGFVETGHPHEKGSSITPDQVESAVWNVIVHGANGINYFAHSFFPGGGGEYASAVTRPEIAERLTKLNARLQKLAPVLNAPGLTGVSAKGDNGIPVTTLHKVVGEDHYVLAQADGTKAKTTSGETKAEITVPVREGEARVVDENRTVPIKDGKIVDSFAAYGFHVYQFPRQG
ncbi:beta-galactosidase [Actinosynnema sp. NPDC020468]|uniref:beta-galactosidase n=1 Tax=Actinosynnema sp. NPDC020468 TaxID=3154488 RepID=UPI0033CE9CE8